VEKSESNADIFVRFASARKPLLGLTILLVEDSRFCSEAVRLLCLRSGARLRRADSLAAARRHLAGYRPAVVMVDLGLPDGSGLELIREVAAYQPRPPVVLATSGDDPAICGPSALAAGADGFIQKPLKNMQVFQQHLLQHLQVQPDVDFTDVISIQPDVNPDQLALREDLDQIAHLLREALDAKDHHTLTYVAQFLRSVAEVAKETELLNAGQALSVRLAEGFRGFDLARAAAEMIDGRLSENQVI